ncbi:MAG: TetR/AcrR family transcriptional regulator [Pseudomonadota bacterium]
MTKMKAPKSPENRLAAAIDDLRSVRDQRPTLTLTTGKTAKSSETIQRILAASMRVFITSGHEGLSLRKVAEEAGMAVGNLNYHFPTKKSLLNATLVERLAEYVDDHLDEIGDEPAAPMEILLSIVTYYARNAQTSHRFFYQMWGYAGSSDEARQLVRSLYQPIGRFIYYLVQAANPDLDDINVRRVVLQIFSLEEGYKLFIGLGPEDDRALKSIEPDIRALTEKLVMSA